MVLDSIHEIENQFDVAITPERSKLRTTNKCPYSE
jgi:hypothetical protein